MQVITIPVTPFAQNSRIVICNETNQAVVIDPGGDTDKIITALNDRQLDLKAIWLTHGHLDHVGGADILRKHFNIQIIGPQKDEVFWFENLPMQAQMFGFTPIAPFYPDIWLNHDDVVSVGKLSFVVKHCPGHTPGHIVFYQPQYETMIVGDVIFKGSIGRTDFPKGDSQQLIESIRAHILTLPDNTKILSGHGSDTTVSFEKQTNPFVSGKFG
ncbi:MBL fold metallo-hydrolase [Pseudoalteromonas carrageenovora]|uniref:MBL fold metallo-hydrolase n=1 Tax=Pseudoalteromonas TaxID=53246 RepID=UPI00073222F0|nr:MULTISPECIES: MBL fold metallo-hydrolase [Pseudoalteromonas]KTF12062.1 MBL fold metallo-hydrolase [Pseudoalteromonas sp. H103]MDO6635477.1 MBL fold metallo-hydrolase [Pseudoalteromonas carrageenovora]MDO6648143.1 MBL fold metallo-hydrolase [Pseudoalteromonas carrageenovora]